MRYRKLGKTGVEISEIGLGAWPLGGRTLIGDTPVTYGEVSEDEARRIIDTALELGVNLIDTAATYGLGRSERIIGRALKGKRNKVFIATKACWIPDKEKIFFRDVSYHNLLATCDRSLMRLDTDYIDLFQVHDGPRNDQEMEIFARVFSELKKSGRARFCGASIGDAMDEGLRLVHSGTADSIQLYYNLLARSPEEKLLPLCHEKGVGVLVAVPLAQGILTGKFNKKTHFPKDDIRSRSQERHHKQIQIAENLRFLERPGEQTLAQAALRFCLEHPAVTAVIPGARTVTQIKANVSASGTKLTKSDMEKISQQGKIHA